MTRAGRTVFMSGTENGGRSRPAGSERRPPKCPLTKGPKSPKVADDVHVNADIFAWRRDRAYDTMFFGAWLSHVPPAAFDDFWALLHTCLAPNGRVAFVDEDDRAAGLDDRYSLNGVPAARRRLSDGREFEIVKVFWRPEDLEDRLRSSGWAITTRRVDETLMYGVGRHGARHKRAPPG